MEEIVNGRPFFEGAQINQQHTWTNGTVGASVACASGSKFQDQSQGWYPRRQTGWSRTDISRGCFGGDHPTQGKGEIPACDEFLRGNFACRRSCIYRQCQSGGHDESRFNVCRSFLQGKCTYGAACKFQHSESHKNGGFRSYGNENFGNAAIAGTSQLSRGKVNADLRSRTFSPERRSVSPCRKFQSGRCHRGASCPYLHSANTAYVRPRYDWGAHLQQEVATIPGSPGFGIRSIENIIRTPKERYEANNGNDLRTRPFPIEPRSRSPCRNFLNGKCFRGASCSYMHTVMFDRPRYDSGRHQDQQLPATSFNCDLGEGTMSITSRRSKRHAGSYLSEDNKTVHEQNRTWPMKGVLPSAFSQANMDITSRSWSAVRQRRRDLHNFGGDKVKLEVCRKFSRGRCDRGESCKYLHDLNEYGRSFPDQSRQPPFKSSRALRNFGGLHQSAPSTVHQKHDQVRNDNMQLSEQKHAGSGLISRDGSFVEKSERQSVNDTVEGNILDQKGETLVMDHLKREISGGAVAGNRDFVDAGEDINSCSRPFKRLRSRCKSPLTTRDKYGRRNISRDEFQDNFPRDRHYNVALFQYPFCGTYQRNKPIHHMDDPSQSKVVAASLASCSQEVSKDSKLVETNSLEKVLSHGMQLGQCVDGSLDLNTELLNQKSEVELAESPVKPSPVKTENKDSKIDAPSDNSCSHEINKDSDPTETQGYDEVTSRGMLLDQCPGGSLDSNTVNQKSEAECAKGDVNTSQVTQDGKGLMTGSHEISISAGTNAINSEIVVSDSTFSCEKNHISPVDTNVSVLNKYSDAEMNINSSPGGSEKTEALQSYSRKRKRRRRSKRLADPMKEEMTDPAIQDPSRSSAGETSLSHPYIVSVTGVSNDMKSTIDHPVQQHAQKNGVLTSKIQNNIVLALPAMEDDPVHVGDSDRHFMRTSDSSLLTANSNSKRKLLVLDLNGLLADIVGDFPGGYEPDTMVSRKGVFKRPFCNDFLEFCFERFDVGVWSSRTKKNVNKVVDFLMGSTKKRLLFCWDQSHCTATGYKTLENRDKPLVLKELKKLWEKQVADLPWEKGYYNETNTILLDDSPYKALRNPPSTAIFPCPYTFKAVKDKSLGPGGDLRVYLEKLAAADNVQKFVQENPFGQKSITKSNKSWGFYSKIVGAFPSRKEGNASCRKRRRKCQLPKNTPSGLAHQPV